MLGITAIDCKVAEGVTVSVVWPVMPLIDAVIVDGSGGYGDGDVSDEFYWAAAELSATTGEGAYLAALGLTPRGRTELPYGGGRDPWDVPTLDDIDRVLQAPKNAKALTPATR